VARRQSSSGRKGIGGMAGENDNERATAKAAGNAVALLARVNISAAKHRSENVKSIKEENDENK